MRAFFWFIFAAVIALVFWDFTVFREADELTPGDIFDKKEDRKK
jgi:hypothetical protein